VENENGTSALNFPKNSHHKERGPSAQDMLQRSSTIPNRSPLSASSKCSLLRSSLSIKLVAMTDVVRAEEVHEGDEGCEELPETERPRLPPEPYVEVGDALMVDDEQPAHHQYRENRMVYLL